jgi:hypothetical protein
MSTLEAKPVIKKMLNPKLLVVAAILLVVLALLFLATPLLRTNSGFQGQAGRTYILRNNGQTLPGGENGFTNPGDLPGGQVYPGQSGSIFPTRRLAGQGGLLGFGLLGGMGGTILYAIALLVSLAAAVGMFMVKRWGKILGIIMAVVYLLLSLLGLLPTLLMSFIGLRNPLTLILNIAELLLAVAVIVLASLPAKKSALPAAPADLPAASA